MTARELVEAAEQAYKNGQPEEAARLLSVARSTNADSPAVLGACGVHALRSGNPGEARTLIERAIAADPTNPGMYLNLASCLRALNDSTAELIALQQALALDPYFFLANIQKASLFERQGKTKLAASAYHAALSSLKLGSQLPVSLQPIVEHAGNCVQAHFRELEGWLATRMLAVRERHLLAAQDRVDDCLAVFLGKKRIYVQQPTFTHFPRLPAISFFDRKEFSWLSRIEAETDNIRLELMKLLESSITDFSPYVAKELGAPLNQWKELNHSRRWSALFLFKDGQRQEAHIARCPRTVAALQLVPMANIAGTAPTAFFSLLEPGTRIPPHTGVTNTRLTVHIPLIVPPHCGLRVGSDVREWHPGTALVFDDSIEHEAWNNSDQPRVVLIFDIWNPLLTDAERDLVAAATSGIAEFYGDSAIDDGLH